MERIPKWRRHLFSSIKEKDSLLRDKTLESAENEVWDVLEDNLTNGLEGYL